MGLCKDIGAIVIPDWAKVDARGAVFRKIKDNNGKWKNQTIGKLVNSSTPEKMMIPNTTFVRLEPEYISDYTNDSTLNTADFIAGPYAVMLRLSAESGLYQAVQRGFGLNSGNALMDFALMSNVLKTSAAYQIESFIDTHLHFSQDRLSSTSLSELLRNIPEYKIKQFRTDWLKTYKEHHADCEVWLSIDGSNHDCKAVGSAIASKGKSKSGNSCNVIGQIWAVDTTTGLPVTWFVNDGNIPDCQAIQEVVKILSEHGITIRGFLLDRGFATNEIIDLILSSGYQYVIMLKGGCSGFEEMLKNHASEIPRNVTRRVSNGGIYGIMDKVKVFKHSEQLSNVGLFFNTFNATDRAEHFSDKVTNELKRLRDAIHDGAFNVTPSDEFASIISIEQSESGDEPVININYDNWQQVYNSKGYFAIACSDGIDINDLYGLYCLRDTSEKVFSELKSQLGFDTLRGHSDWAILSRVAVSFIAAVLRQMFVGHCKKLDLSANIMMQKLQRVSLVKDGDAISPSFTAGKQVNELFKSIGVMFADFNDLAIQVTSVRNGSRLDECRTMYSLSLDQILTVSEDRYRVYKERKQVSEKASIKRKAGRPKGVKNKKTLDREMRTTEQTAQSSSSMSDEFSCEAKPEHISQTEHNVEVTTTVVKKSPGRPKGSKNKKTLEKERIAAEQAAAQLASTVKRRPGRPKGSLNKKTIALNEKLAAERAKEKRGRGRPKGSLNKKTIALNEKLAAERAKAKRGRGRPKGSKNKSTLAAEAEALQSQKQGHDRPSVSRTQIAPTQDTSLSGDVNHNLASSTETSGPMTTAAEADRIEQSKLQSIDAKSLGRSVGEALDVQASEATMDTVSPIDESKVLDDDIDADSRSYGNTSTTSHSSSENHDGETEQYAKAEQSKHSSNKASPAVVTNVVVPPDLTDDADSSDGVRQRDVLRRCKANLKNVNRPMGALEYALALNQELNNDPDYARKSDSPKLEPKRMMLLMDEEFLSRSSKRNRGKKKE